MAGHGDATHLCHGKYHPRGYIDSVRCSSVNVLSKDPLSI